MSTKTKQLIAKSERCSQVRKGLGGFFSNNAFVIMAFLIPFLIMLINFAIKKFAPFGDQQILVVDLWHQYYPFLVDFQDKIISGQSMLQSWSNGMGGNYLALMSYYVASPINFLTAFVPADFLREFLMLSVCVEVGCASGFMALFLKKTFKKNGLPLVIFSAGYGCCAFFMGYYWNVIWLNTVAMLPLVALGMVMLWREKKFVLYTIALALSIIANYYVGLFACIFVLLCFIGYSIMYWNGIKDFFGRLMRTGLFSGIALMITAFMTLPAFNGLQLTVSTNNQWPDSWRCYYEWSEIMSQTLDFIPPSTKENLPNLACGMSAIFFGIIFLTTRKINWRAKSFAVGLLVFLVCSTNVNILDYIWHGLHSTNMIPHRFAYLFSFVLLTIAYRAYTLIDKARLWDILIGFFGATLLVVVSTTVQAGAVLWGSFALVCVMAVACICYSFKIYPKVVLDLIIFAVVMVETFTASFIGIKTVGSTGTQDYPKGEAVTASLVNEMYRLETNTTDMWRAEMTQTQTLNDSSLNDFNGVSQFSSMSNVSVTKFLEEIGCQGWQGGNRYTYRESTPVTNTFLNLKYLISRDNVYSQTKYVSPVFQNGSETLLKNNYYLPMGFVTNKELLNYTLEDRNGDDFSTLNTFGKQNELFSKATGINEDVFTIIEPMGASSSSQINPVTINKMFSGSAHGYDYIIDLTSQPTTTNVEFVYDIKEKGTYFVYGVYYNATMDSKGINIKKDGNSVKSDGDVSRPYIMNAGDFEQGQKLSVSLDNLPSGTSTNFLCFVAKLNDDVFQKGYEKLSQSTMNATSVTDTEIEGVIDCKEDGLFYTSVVYEEGWSVKVDGEKVDTKAVGNAMLCFDITKGQHTIEMSYLPKGYLIGTLASILGIILLIACAFLYRPILSKTFLFKYNTHPDANPENAYKDDEQEEETDINSFTDKEKETATKQPSLLKHGILTVLFSIFYFIAWLGTIIKKTKILLQENSSYAGELILSLLCPFYFVYVMYKYGKKKENLATTESLKVKSAFSHMAIELGASGGIFVSAVIFLQTLISNFAEHDTQVKNSQSVVAGGGEPIPITISLLPQGTALAIAIICGILGLVLRFANLYMFDNDLYALYKRKNKEPKRRK